VCVGRQVPLDHRDNEDLRATLDHRDLLDFLARQDHKETPALQVHLDLLVHQVQLELLETQDILATVDSKVRQDLQGQQDHRDLKDQLDNRDSSGLPDRQVNCCFITCTGNKFWTKSADNIKVPNLLKLKMFNSSILHRVRKLTNSILGITSSNTCRFSQFFQCHKLLEICNKTVIKFPTTPQTRRYTTW